MIKIHEKASRGRTRSGWLDSYHTFSFGQFNDPTRMGFANLRVINEDTVIPGSGFAAHDHDNMDILTVVMDGQLRHEDDQGNVAVISSGEIQGMSAGQGVRHSEFNASTTDAAKFLQIWLIPDELGGAPLYAQSAIPSEGDVLLAGPSHAQPLIQLRSNARLTLRRLQEGQVLDIPADGVTDHFVHLLDGLVMAETERVSAGDGLEIPRTEAVSLAWQTDGSALVFEMPSGVPSPRSAKSDGNAISLDVSSGQLEPQT
jgi:redox-sensitive bicupin YhaK (pirin superfamily)